MTVPPILTNPAERNHWCYTTTIEYFVGALLAQVNAEGKENALYFLSRKLVGARKDTPLLKDVLGTHIRHP